MMANNASHMKKQTKYQKLEKWISDVGGNYLLITKVGIARARPS